MWNEGTKADVAYGVAENGRLSTDQGEMSYLAVQHLHGSGHVTFVSIEPTDQQSHPRQQAVPPGGSSSTRGVECMDSSVGSTGVRYICKIRRFVLNFHHLVF